MIGQYLSSEDDGQYLSSEDEGQDSPVRKKKLRTY